MTPFPVGIKLGIQNNKNNFLRREEIKLNLLIHLTFHYFWFAGICAWICAHECPGRPQVPNVHGLELRAILSCPVGILGTELRSLKEAVHALNHWVISLDSSETFKNKLFYLFIYLWGWGRVSWHMCELRGQLAWGSHLLLHILSQNREGGKLQRWLRWQTV